MPNTEGRQRIKSRFCGRHTNFSRNVVFTDLSTSKKILKNMMNPLRFIICDRVGSRSQLDLIDMRLHEVKGMKWILHYVDCLSNFSQICCLPIKSSVVVGKQ